MGNLAISMKDSPNPAKAQRIRRFDEDAKMLGKVSSGDELAQVWHGLAR
jgi:hypothetical protein